MFLKLASEWELSLIYLYISRERWIEEDTQQHNKQQNNLNHFAFQNMNNISANKELVKMRGVGCLFVNIFIHQNVINGIVDADNKQD